MRWMRNESMVERTQWRALSKAPPEARVRFLGRFSYSISHVSDILRTVKDKWTVLFNSLRVSRLWATYNYTICT